MATFTQIDVLTKTLKIDEKFPGYREIKEQVKTTFVDGFISELASEPKSIVHLKGHTSGITQLAPVDGSKWGWTFQKRNLVKHSYYIANDGYAEKEYSFANVKAIGINDFEDEHSKYRIYGKFALQSNIKPMYLEVIKNKANIGGYTFTEEYGLHGAVVTTVLRDFCTEKGWTYRPVVILNEGADGIPGPALQDELEYWAIKDPEFQGFRN